MWSNDGIAWILWGQAWNKQEAGDGAGLGYPGVGESLDGTVEYKAKPDVFLFIILVSFPLPFPASSSQGFTYINGRGGVGGASRARKKRSHIGK